MCVCVLRRITTEIPYKCLSAVMESAKKASKRYSEGKCLFITQVQYDGVLYKLFSLKIAINIMRYPYLSRCIIRSIKDNLLEWIIMTFINYKFSVKWIFYQSIKKHCGI